jgi:hypothetical protein
MLAQPSNGLRIRVAQTTPAQPAAPSSGAQPGQSTIPLPSSSPTGVAPPQGALPGQSTVPSPSSTPPGTTPAPGTQPDGTAPAPGTPTFQQPAIVVPRVFPPTQVVVPPQQVVVPPTDVVVPAPAPIGPTDPFLDGSGEELPILDEYQDYEEGVDGCSQRRGVRPYGGGRPGDWYWGCNGSPYRTGPGMCDDWRVGLRWHVTVDGIVMSHENADLASLESRLREIDEEGTNLGDPLLPLTPTFDQFDPEAGGRITFTSQVAKYTGWDMQFAYEGIPQWNASIVYPKLPLDPPLLPPPGLPQNIDPMNPPLVPLAPADLATEQRRFHYTSSLHSGALNAIAGSNPTWRPFFGVRYIKFDDEINDFYDQEAPPPLPAQLGVDDDPPPTLPSSVVTDRLNLFDVQNNLMGFQVGLLHDTWRVNRRFALEGFINGGVYYNRVKYTNLMGTFTTQFVADNLDTIDFNEQRTDFSDTVNNDVREYSEISYVGEASLTGVCRLNKCWALRGGYQALWIANVHLAEDAYLGNENVAQDLLFHGWHAGIECRR